MLPAENRLRDSDTFRETVRRGRRVGGRVVVLHLLSRDDAAAPRCGLVVSKAVGQAVTRNLVKRRLRHLLRERLTSLPTGGVLVVRALPAAAETSYDGLGRELDRGLGRLLPGSEAPVVRSSVQ